MAGQLSLFGANGDSQQALFGPQRGMVGAEHPDTSRTAAAEVAPRTGTQRWRVLNHLRLCGPDGATDAELQDALHMNGNTERPRRVELVDGGWVEDSGDRRVSGGRPAIIWRATAQAVELAERAEVQRRYHSAAERLTWGRR